ncbi:unnamed protein product [Trichobilharzia szidati]|nr:unnamed protein product [Trichobilharzia szidati]
MDLASLDILHEICTVNGIHSENLSVDIFRNHILYILFSGFSKWISLQSFPFLTELIIISQEINQIAKLETCPNLKKLWLCECKIVKIENLNSCKQLTELYLYENYIKKIENLTGNRQLECLWLNDNQISVIEGLNDLKALKHLNLSGNNITSLNNSLKCNQRLEELSISGNKLWNPDDISTLTKLPHLTSLCINEPEYLKNPLCNNPNLPIILIYRLPQLCKIDHINIDYADLKSAVKCIIQSKKSYYMMKCENYRTRIERKIYSIKEFLNNIRNKIYAHIKLMDKTLRAIQNSQMEQMKNGSVSGGSNDLNNLSYITSQFTRRIVHWENLHRRYQLECDVLCNRLQQHLDLRQSLYELELQMFGYLVIEEGSVANDWFIYCSEFLISRFCCHGNLGSIVSGIKVLHVYKISNTIFQSASSQKDCTDNSDCRGSTVGKLAGDRFTFIDYLFMIRPEKSEDLKVYLDVMRVGFHDDNKNKYKLTNSINTADSVNLQKLCCDISEPNFSQYNYTARLLVVRSSVLKVRKTNGTGNKINNNNTNSNNDDSPRTEESEIDMSSGSITFYKTTPGCSCPASREITPIPLQSEYLYPEFLVEVEYILKNNPRDSSLLGQLNNNSDFEVNSNQQQELNDEMKIDQNFIIKTTPPPMVAKDSSQSLMTSRSLEVDGYNANEHSLTILDIKLFKSLNFQKCFNLRILSITHCQLQKLPVLQCNSLSTLIISHNKFNSLQSFSKMPNLTELTADYNQLVCIIDVVSTLNMCTPKLEKLSLRENPWKAENLVRIYTLTKLPHIKYFNCQAVSSREIEIASGLLDSCTITPKMIRNMFSQTTNAVNPTTSNLLGSTSDNSSEYYQNLTIYPVAFYNKHLNAATECLSIINFNIITSLCLESLNIFKIQNLDSLTNLKYLSLNHNSITKIEGLSSCSNLIELSLEFNCIESIENICHLKKLECLHLGNNMIKVINDFQLECLCRLHVLGLRSNNITKLNGIDCCKQLNELYLGNNKLKDIKNILYLKKLPNLSILDLSGNLIVEQINNYRLQVIYYLKSIKSLDGIEVNPMEIVQSKELFDGRLSCEYLMEYLENDDFSNLVRLDLPKCMLKVIDFLDPYRLIHLKSINLEKNYLTSFGGLVFLTNLKVICLNENNIEGLFSRNICSLAMNSNYQLTNSIESRYVSLYRSTQPIYPCLRVLHLAQNGIRSLQEFQFHRMTSLQALFLQDNELVTINGLEGLNQLKELVLDNNRIKYITELSFLYNWTLQEIHLENNSLRELSNLSKLENLKRLYIGGNKLNDFNDLEKFAQNQRNLFEISLTDNPIASRHIHRLILVHYIPKLQFIDGIQVTDEERDKITWFYEDRELPDSSSTCGVILSPGWNNHHHHHQVGKGNQLSGETALPGINTQKQQQQQ